MTVLVSHSVDAESVENETPIFVPETGTFHFNDGKVALCITWDKEIIFKSIIKNQEDDYDI